jgi:hypothetical protein
MKESTDIWKLYETNKDYNLKLNYYSTVSTNERMTYGNQWEGADVGDLPTPQFNLFRRVINQIVSFLMSSKTTISYSALNISTDNKDPNQQAILQTVETLNDVVQVKMEEMQFDRLCQESLQEGCLTGDMASFFYWDDEIDTGQKNGVKGDFCFELVDGVNVLFGNPNVGRDLVENLKSEAKTNKMKKEDIDSIVSDVNYEYTAGDRGKIELDKAKETGKATYIIKLWIDKDTKRLNHQKVTKNATITEVKKTKLKLYPLAWGNWDKRKNSYHGQALITETIQNQIYINKLLAMVFLSIMRTSYPKVVYNKSLIDEWDDSVGSAIGVNASDDIGKVAKYLDVGQMSEQVFKVIETAVKMTLDSLGANEVFLGDVNPENTSAIVQVTKQSAMQFSNQQANLYDYIEQQAYIIIDFIQAYYGNVQRDITITNEDGTQTAVPFNASLILDKILIPKVDVGPSTYWSEIASANTLDNLLKSQVMSVIQYLERYPDGYIPKKDELIKELQKQAEQMNGVQANQFENMAKFMETLPPEQQAKLQALPPQEMEAELKNIITNAPQESMKQEIYQTVGKALEEILSKVNNQEQTIGQLKEKVKGKKVLRDSNNNIIGVE